MKKRVQTTDPEEWRRHVKSFKSKGETTKSDYCRRNGLAYHRFLYWDEKYETGSVEGVESEWVNLGMPTTESPVKR